MSASEKKEFSLYDDLTFGARPDELLKARKCEAPGDYYVGPVDGDKVLYAGKEYTVKIPRGKYVVLYVKESRKDNFDKDYRTEPGCKAEE